MFLVVGTLFTLVYMPASPDGSFTQKFSRRPTDAGSSYNIATENDIKVISAAAAMFYRHAGQIHFHRCGQYPTSENSIRYKPEIETLPKTGSMHVSLFSEVGYRRFESSRA